MNEIEFMAYLRAQAEIIDAWLNAVILPELFEELQPK